jgi:hypothetical protein
MPNFFLFFNIDNFFLNKIVQSLNNEWSKMVAENFKVNENQQKLVIEGVQPEVIVQEVLSARLDNVFKVKKTKKNYLKINYIF